MIDYIFIILAVCCFAAQFAFTKLFERAAGQGATSSLVMLVFTSLIGVVIFFFAGGLRVNFSSISLIWAGIFAVVMIPYYMIGIKVLSLGSLAIYSMFMMLGGMLVPFFYGILFLYEPISIGKIAGTILLTAFIVLQAVWQNSSNGEKKSNGKVKFLFFALCLVIFFINGMMAVITKAHSISVGAVDEMSFTVIYCAMTTVLSLVILIFSCFKNGKDKMVKIKESLKIKPIIVMAFLGAAAYGGNFLQLITANKVPASVQFPLVSGGVIVISALVSAFLFKEKVSKKEWISVAGAFVSTFLFAF